MSGGSFSRGARWSLGLQTALAAALAVAAAVLAITAAEWRPVRLRFDATADRANSLDPQTAALLEQLPEPAEVDLLMRPVVGPYREAVAEATQRLRRLLFLAREAAPDKLVLREADPGDLAAFEARLRELDVPQGVVNVAVVTVGARRTLLRLEPDVATFALGNPDPQSYVPSSVRAFRGEEALAEALGRVGTGEPPRVLFTTGQGEPRLTDPDGRELDRLRRELELEGLRVETWDLAAQGVPPEDADLLCVVGAAQPFSDTAWTALEAWRDRGGALLVVLGPAPGEGPRAAEALLPPLGLEAARGVAAAPLVNPMTGALVVGTPAVTDLLLGPADLSSRHPITAPLQSADRRVAFRFARTLERFATEGSGLVAELAWTPPDAWLDLPDARGQFDWRPDPAAERDGRFRLAAAVEDYAVEGDAADAGAGGRAVVFASVGVLAHDPQAGGASPLLVNRDFVLNTFNWLVEREHRVRIASRSPFEARLDVARGAPARTVFRLALWGLPGLCLAAAALTLLRRR